MTEDESSYLFNRYSLDAYWIGDYWASRVVAPELGVEPLSFSDQIKIPPSRVL